jgi:DNA-binding transcriptional LysR family regulator
MEIRQLRYFSRAAKAGSILRAASELQMSQPALSRQLARFEAEIGAVLFSRSTRGVVLTELGHRLLNHSEKILGALDDAERDINDAKAVPSGVVTLGATPSVTAVLLRPLIERFRSLYPGVCIHVTEAFSGHIADWIEKGEVDVGLIYHPADGAEIQTERILQEEMFLVCPPDMVPAAEKLTFANLAGLNMILPRRRDGLRTMIEEHEELNGVRLQVGCEVDSCNAALQLVSDGLGYSIMPHAYAAPAEKAGRVAVVRLPDTSFVRDIYIAWSKAAPLSLGARELARQLRLQAHDLVQRGIWHGCKVVD